MTMPGKRLRAICARFCGARTLARLIDPVLSDLQTEYLDARGRGQVWRSRWIRAAGSMALFKAVAIYGCERATRTLGDWSADDRRSVWRLIAFSSVGVVAVMVLCVVPPLQRLPRDLAVYVIPQALPLAIPLGVTFGMFGGLGGGGGVVSARLRGAALAIALAGSVASFATMAWMIPAANQAFRIAVAERVPAVAKRVHVAAEGVHAAHAARGVDVGLSKGPLEMTLSELRQKIDSTAQTGFSRGARNLTLGYHTRFALPSATLALALFGVAITPRLSGRRLPGRRWILAAAACGACLVYFVLLFAATTLGREGALPVIVAAWLPNAVFAMASTAWLITTRAPSRQV